MDVQVMTVRRTDIWKNFLEVPSVTAGKQFLWYWFFLSWVLQRIFFSSGSKSDTTILPLLIYEHVLSSYITTLL